MSYRALAFLDDWIPHTVDELSKLPLEDGVRKLRHEAAQRGVAEAELNEWFGPLARILVKIDHGNRDPRLFLLPTYDAKGTRIKDRSPSPH